jgi:uncharacterized protein YneF (UPF0154 family)
MENLLAILIMGITLGIGIVIGMYITTRLFYWLEGKNKKDK